MAVNGLLTQAVIELITDHGPSEPEVDQAVVETVKIRLATGVLSQAIVEVIKRRITALSVLVDDSLANWLDELFQIDRLFIADSFTLSDSVGFSLTIAPGIVPPEIPIVSCNVDWMAVSDEETPINECEDQFFTPIE